MSRQGWRTGLFVSALGVAALDLASPGMAREAMTAGEFLAACDELDPGCRNEFVVGLQTVYEAHFACPPRIDANTPISGWLAYMRSRVKGDPGLAGADKNRLQLEAFEGRVPSDGVAQR
jgi:hypothetical protein